MTVCMYEKGLYVSLPGFFPCTAKEMPAKMITLIEQIKRADPGKAQTAGKKINRRHKAQRQQKLAI